MNTSCSKPHPAQPQHSLYTVGLGEYGLRCRMGVKPPSKKKQWAWEAIVVRAPKYTLLRFSSQWGFLMDFYFFKELVIGQLLLLAP